MKSLIDSRIEPGVKGERKKARCTLSNNGHIKVLEQRSDES